MKIPKYVDAILKRRTKLSKQLDEVCDKLDRWLLANDIDPDSSCWLTGVETYIHPDASEEEVRRAINEKE